MKKKIVPLQQILEDRGIDAFLISSPSLIIYLTDYNGFSLSEREAFLIITSQNNYLITDRRYSDEVKKKIRGYILIERNSSFKKNLETIIKKEHLETIGFEEQNLTVAEYNSFKKFFNLLPFSLDKLRSIKTDDEIKNIQQASSIGDEAFNYLLTKIRLDQTEKELAFLLEEFAFKKNVKLSFPSIVAFGENSAIPHHQTDDTKLKKNDIILLDFGITYKNYCSDMSRTIFLGEPTNEQKKAYLTVRNAQIKARKKIEKALSLSSPISATEIDSTSRKYIVFHGYPDIPHALGHGIGIEVHEAPSLSKNSKDYLYEGMVFSIEPGIYIPGRFGIRIEDLFTIKNKKLLRLTNSSTSLIAI